MGIPRELKNIEYALAYVRARISNDWIESSKGQIEPGLVGAIALVAVGAFALFVAAPSLIEDVETLMKLSTSETVALDLGGLITISAAAPESISLSYSSLREDETYNIEVGSERMVYVDTPIESVQGSAKLGIYLPPQSDEDVSSFTISKSRTDGENLYDFVVQ